MSAFSPTNLYPPRTSLPARTTKKPGSFMTHLMRVGFPWAGGLVAVCKAGYFQARSWAKQVFHPLLLLLLLLLLLIVTESHSLDPWMMELTRAGETGLLFSEWRRACLFHSASLENLQPPETQGEEAGLSLWEHRARPPMLQNESGVSAPRKPALRTCSSMEQRPSPNHE